MGDPGEREGGLQKTQETWLGTTVTEGIKSIRGHSAFLFFQMHIVRNVATYMLQLPKELFRQDLSLIDYLRFTIDYFSASLRSLRPKNPRNLWLFFLSLFYFLGALCGPKVRVNRR